MSNLKSTCFLLLNLLFWGDLSYASTKTINPLITYRCDNAADILVITNSLLTPSEAKTFQFSDDKGTYNPWDLVKIDPVKHKTSPLSNKTIVKKCTLSSGKYTATIAPKIFSNDISGPCGTSISGTVSIEYDGFEIFEKRAFEDYCHGNA